MCFNRKWIGRFMKFSVPMQMHRWNIKIRGRCIGATLVGVYVQKTERKWFIWLIPYSVARRRSNVVKEVEKLKKNREERRIRQAEIKTEKENLMNLDPGNPNWEFLSMIREYRHNLEFTPLRETDAVEEHQITVCVRKRPMNKKGMTRDTPNGSTSIRRVPVCPRVISSRSECLILMLT